MYEVGLHIEGCSGMFNDVYTVKADNYRDAKAKAVARFRRENDCSGITMIQVTFVEGVNV